MLTRLDDPDWKEAFEYADGPTPVQFGAPAETASFTRDDVVEIVAAEEGENDGADWLGVFHLSDGRYAVLRAGCDYTGWD